MRSKTILAVLLALLAVPAGAAVLTVTKTADTLDGACDPYDCSLREAIAEANRLGDTDVIELPAGVYILTRASTGGGGEDQNVSGDLDINRPVIVVGAGAGSTVIDGNATDRVLDIRAETEIFGVTVRNGLVDGPGAGAYAHKEILDYRFVVRRSVITGNHARGLNGDGGGVVTQTGGGLMVIESTVSGNRADANGGGLFAERWMAVLSSTVSGNSAGQYGGGLYYPQFYYAWIAGSTIADNQAGQVGGGIYAVPLEFPAGVEAQLEGSIVAGNTAPAFPDCSGADSNGYNVIGIVETGTAGGCDNHATDRKGTAAAPLDAKLGPLAGQGGPTPVHALLPGSPALDLVPAEHCMPSDQLGQRRAVFCEAGAVEQPSHPTCLPGGPVLCLAGGRFRVTALWSGTGNQGGTATAAPLTDDTGNFWFFAPQNLEVTVKVIDGCGLNDRWWVFTSGLTDRGVDLRVEDLFTGEVWTHHQSPGTTYAPRLDTSAIDGCEGPEGPFQPGPAGTLPVDPVSSVLVVTKGEDTLDGACDSDCSLREAVTASNKLEGIQVILLGPKVHALSIAGRNENGNATGDLDVTGHLVILGQGADHTAIDGGGLDRVLEAAVVNSSLEIHGVTVRNGRAEAGGSGHPGDGGGLRGGTLTLVGCHVTGSSAATWGGGFAGDTVIARDTTVSNNQANVGGGVGFASVLRLTNVTVSGNHATIAGGGVIIDAYDQVLESVTITGNSSAQGGGLYVGSATCPSGICKTDFSMFRSIVAGNTAEEGPDCFGGGSNGGSLFGIDDGCDVGPTDRAGTIVTPLDPRLTPLGNHGDSTPTHALLPGSPAIDLGSVDGCPARDQRGKPRPVDGDANGFALCDAGAVEYRPGCQPDETTLCLGEGDRFRVTARWAARGEEGAAQAIPLVTDTGSFWFFNPANVELTLKVLDGCAVNNRFWVFVSGLTDVRVDVTVEDTVTGRTWTYRNNAGTAFQPRLDTGALDVCPVTE
ncbi:MAG TPA: CSLREA domain-containing protein [Thermoanaerobaculia bacterium]|jgi:CSLREA domain-containing protein|nr:CSLREA domain-containing protein [Thermoanaerobaculia bacterium]